MISHEHKCIFIHIPRTGGTSVENFFVGGDWYHLGPDLNKVTTRVVPGAGPATKHLLASQAKRIYSDYWDDYFKFSIVRNPWSRHLSLSKYHKFYGAKFDNNTGLLDPVPYVDKFKASVHPHLANMSDDVLVELDNRSEFLETDVIGFKPNQIYLNILNEELDFICRFESFSKDMEYVSNKLGTDFSKFPHVEKVSQAHNRHRVHADTLNYSKHYTPETSEFVRNIYSNDIEYFSYNYG